MRLLWHSPYVWGGESIEGTDCSGTISFALYLLGYNIRTTAHGFAEKFSTALGHNCGSPGDIAIWYHENRFEARHIAMFSDNNMIMDADATGIIDEFVWSEMHHRRGQRFEIRQLSFDALREASSKGSDVFGVDKPLSELFGVLAVPRPTKAATERAK